MKKLKWKQLSDCGEVFQVSDIFSEKYYTELLDEFRPDYNHIQYDKREYDGEPSFGEFVDTSIAHKGTKYQFNDGLGWNYKLIDSAFYAKYAAQKILKRDLHLMRINTNFQFFGMEAGWHNDYRDEYGPGPAWSFVIYINDYWDYTYGGQFVVATKYKEYLNVNPVPNTGCLFNARLVHRGGAPNRFCVDRRMSLAFLFEEV